MENVPLDDLGIDHQPLGDVLQGAEDDVSSQEGLGQGDSPARGVTRCQSNDHIQHNINVAVLTCKIKIKKQSHLQSYRGDSSKISAPL